MSMRSYIAYSNHKLKPEAFVSLAKRLKVVWGDDITIPCSICTGQLTFEQSMKLFNESGVYIPEENKFIIFNVYDAPGDTAAHIFRMFDYETLNNVKWTEEELRQLSYIEIVDIDILNIFKSKKFKTNDDYCKWFDEEFKVEYKKEYDLDD